MVERTGCPSVARLQADRVLDRHSYTKDRWGNAYIISCELGDELTHPVARFSRELGTPPRHERPIRRPLGRGPSRADQASLTPGLARR